jgi:hypothetical protein
VQTYPLHNQPAVSRRAVLFLALLVGLVLAAALVVGVLDPAHVVIIGAGPVTLAQARNFVTNALDRNVVDEFRKVSILLDRIPFDQAVSPSGGGATLTYGYNRVTSQRSAAFRALNSEYTPQEAAVTPYTVDLKPLGGSFQIDRVLAAHRARMRRLGAEVTFQMSDKLKATNAHFADQLINGDTRRGCQRVRRAQRRRSPAVTTEVQRERPVDWT